MQTRPNAQPDAGWHNRLPTWIREHPEYKRLPLSMRRTLQAIANACNPPEPETGDLIGAFGGRQLAADAGVCKRTLFNHINRLEQAGFIITLGRGGTLGSRSFGNVYGLPGAPHSLNQRRARRRMQRMVRGADGKFRPEIIQPGEQITIWPRTPATPATPATQQQSKEVEARGSPPPVVEDLALPPCKVARGVVQKGVQSCTPPYPHDSPCDDHEHGGLRSQRSGRRPKRRAGQRAGVWTLGHIRRDDLTETSRLLELLDQAVAAGLVPAGDRGRIAWVAAAEHALRVGNKPEALFRSIVEGPRGSGVLQCLWISEGDEAAAQRRLARHERERTMKRRNSTSSPKGNVKTSKRGRAPDPDSPAEILRRQSAAAKRQDLQRDRDRELVRQAMRETGRDPGHVVLAWLKRLDPTFTMDRVRAAVATDEESRDV